MSKSTDRTRASPASTPGSVEAESPPLVTHAPGGLPASPAESHGLALIASAHAAIFSTDPGGIIRSWNPGSELLFGYGREEAIGMPIAVLSPPGREAEEKGILDQALGGARIERYDTQQLRKGGELIDR